MVMMISPNLSLDAGTVESKAFRSNAVNSQNMLIEFGKMAVILNRQQVQINHKYELQATHRALMLMRIANSWLLRRAG